MKAVVLALVVALPVFTKAAATPVRYTLLNDSFFLNDCPICGRPAIAEPTRGSFEVVVVSETATTRSCLLTNLQFVTRADPPRSITGYGTLDLEFGARTNQVLTLVARVNGEQKVFTNDFSGVIGTWPMIHALSYQTQYNLVSFDSMEIVAAPVRELWFTTSRDFSSTNSPRIYRAGDVLSLAGRVVKDRAAIAAGAGVVASTPLDVVTVEPGGAVLFSLTTDSMSSTGLVAHGDVLTTRDTLRWKNGDLIRGFEPDPAEGDRGLDALYVGNNGRVYFSTAADFVSLRIGEISHGDVLVYEPAGQGTNLLLKTRQQLLSEFQPLRPELNPGLDALYVWPHGEIWFSTAQGFDSQRLGPISPGDLLSDQGRFVVRQNELLEMYGSGTAEPGLGTVYVVADASAAQNLPFEIKPRFSGSGPGSVTLQWTGGVRTFQVDKAAAIMDAFVPATEIMPGWQWAEPTSGTQSFYRLRGW